jgi:hypothetical protein
MVKPLFRWTVGNCLQQGLDILAESVKRTMRALGAEEWDWAICYNGINREQLEFLQKMIGDRPVKLIAQSWATCPVDDDVQTPRRRDGSFEWNGTRCGGTMWKVCPARMRMESHEVVMDNDIVLLSKFSQFEEFLNSNDKVLLLEEPIRFYGRYDCLFGGSESFLNSGLMGFPPGYDFGVEIAKNWKKYGSYRQLTQADEQGLLTYTLNQQSSVKISKEQMLELLHRDFGAALTGREEGIHFTQSNRIPNHHAWKKYQEILSRSTI